MKLSHLLLVAGLCVSSATLAATDNYRQRLSARQVSEADLTADLKAEIEFGRNLATRVLGRYELANEKALNHYLNLVGSGVAHKGPRQELAYHFALLASGEVNAYAAPGGYVFVTRGAVDLMRDESELAAVLAHEIAHITGRDIVRELRIQGTDTSAGAGMARFFGGATEAARVALSQAVDQATTMLFEEGYKREDEFAADRTATLLLANAGYDPLALRRYLARLAKAKGKPSDVVYRTHPSFADRLAKLDAFIAEQGLARVEFPRVQARFNRNVTATENKQ